MIIDESHIGATAERTNELREEINADVILEMSREYYRNGGAYFLLKGRREKIEEELSLARKKTKDLKSRLEILKSPVLEVERHLVLIN